MSSQVNLNMEVLDSDVPHFVAGVWSMIEEDYFTINSGAWDKQFKLDMLSVIEKIQNTDDAVLFKLQTVKSGYILAKGSYFLYEFLENYINNSRKVDFLLEYVDTKEIIDAALEKPSNSSNCKLGKDKYNNIVSSILVLVFLGGVVVFNSKNTNSDVSKNSKIVSSDVIAPYTKDQYPDIYRKYKNQIQRINNLRVAAANAVVKLDSCDSVVLSELSPKKNSKKDLIVFVDCKNESRYYVSESMIKNGDLIKSKANKAVSQRDFMYECWDYVRNNAKNPDSIVFHITESQSSLDPSEGTWRATVGFNANNDFGQSIHYFINCELELDGVMKFNVYRK